MKSPTDTPHESNRVFYDRISGIYDLMSDASERAARVKGLELLDVQPGEQVLEIGFGTGGELVDLARKVGSDGRIAGVDVSDGMRKVAARKLATAGLTDVVELHVADARELPFADGTFDAVYCSFTLELFPAADVSEVLAGVRRVLKPAGRFAVVSMATVKDGEHPSTLERAYVWMHRHFPHIVDCRPIDVAATLQAGGFKVIASESLEIWTLPVTAAVAVR